MRSITSVFIFVVCLSLGWSQQSTPVSAPLTTDSVGNRALDVVPAVFRVQNVALNESGTGFLHKSGFVITAAHVVKGAAVDQIIIRDFAGNEFKATRILSDEQSDIAIIEPHLKIVGPSPLELSEGKNHKPGRQVEAWGFPAGYNGASAMLVVGYIAGIDENVRIENGTIATRLVVNAAFNGGNSGGPVIDLEDGKVIGVVSAKLTPTPPQILAALEALRQQQSGFGYTYTKPDGTKENIMEAQVVAMILTFLRSQTQLVVGHAVRVSDIRALLQKNGIKP